MVDPIFLKTEVILMEISVFLTFIGIMVWPELTLCIILWKLGHPVLGVFALVSASTTSVKTIHRTRKVHRLVGTGRQNWGDRGVRTTHHQPKADPTRPSAKSRWPSS